MKLKSLVLIMLMSGTGLSIAQCTPSEPNELDKLGTVDITINGQKFRLWIADSSTETARGLMFVTAKEMAPLEDGTERGMIFVFAAEQYLSFWMKNTIIPLDIAYVNGAGDVVGTHTMAPLDDRIGQYPSNQPARFAIEVNAGVWSRIGLTQEGTVDIPESVLNR